MNDKEILYYIIKYIEGSDALYEKLLYEIKRVGGISEVGIINSIIDHLSFSAYINRWIADNISDEFFNLKIEKYSQNEKIRDAIDKLNLIKSGL